MQARKNRPQSAKTGAASNQMAQQASGAWGQPSLGGAPQLHSGYSHQDLQPSKANSGGVGNHYFYQQ